MTFRETEFQNIYVILSHEGMQYHAVLPHNCIAICISAFNTSIWNEAEKKILAILLNSIC